MVTVAATVASTWALDLVATVAGVALVATPALDGASRGVVLGFLAATYVLWVAGLRTNLVANWRLLEETGTSTNALSKLLFDVALSRSSNQRAVRAASVTGYVVTELAKEVPYYAGAFGAVLLSDAIDATDALVFLGGANIGAAIYEYALARLTRSFLDGRSRRIARRVLDAEPEPSYASFETDWVPQHYLHDYYRDVEPDEQATIAFFVEALRHADPGEPVLMFGVGPTLHHVFLAAPASSEIHLADYLPTNLQEIERWLIGETGAHDWRPFVEYTLACEGVAGPTSDQVSDREALARGPGSPRCSPATPASPTLLGGHGSPPYGTVISAYCADSATADAATWATYLRNIAGLVRPGGLFVTAALRHATGYVVGDQTFPSASVDEDDLRRVLEPCFDWDDGLIEVCDLSAGRSHGYASVVLAHVRRREGTAD